MPIVIVTVLVVIIILLLVYNLSIHKKIQTFNNLNQKIANLNVLQDFMSTIGEYLTVDEKIKKINDILIEKYEIKYSTIVVFDGAEYQVKASNVDEKHWNTLKNLQNVEMFQDSIQSAIPKYVTVNNDRERLPYQQMEFGRAKSAIFFPLYIDNVYIGYWIIESGTPHDFDNVDTTIFEVVKDNIVAILKTVKYQKVLESIVREDQFTGLYTREYLFGEGKNIIDKNTISTICMFTITNIQDINRRFSRELGNKVITKVSNYIQDNISEDYIFVRYMGPKFVIVFSGAEVKDVVNFITDIKINIEKFNIALEDEKTEEVNEIEEVKPKRGRKKKEKAIAIPKLNFVISTYYKGTGIEEVLNKLEEYLDNTDTEESDITSI